VKKNLVRWNERFWFILSATVIFGVSFALVEAAAIIYFRKVLGLGPSNLEMNISPSDIFLQVPNFALLKASVFEIAIKDKQFFNFEIFREAATMFMLASFGLVAGKNWWQRFGVFLMAFGIWDIFYYVFLYVFISWPQTITTLDVLFFIPLPWVSPVWLPVTISAFMITTGIMLLWRFRKKEGFL